MKTVLFVFSGTGNTRFAAMKIAEQFEEGSIALVSIERHRKDAQALVEASDLIGLAYPIYGSDAPSLVKSFVKTLSGNRKPAFVVCTQLMFSGDGAAVGGRLLNDQGFDVRWQEHFFLPNNITDVGFLKWFRAASPATLERRTKKKAKRFVKRIQSGKPFRKGSNPLSWMLGQFQRVPFRAMEESWATHRLRVDSFLCIGCKICVNACPTQNFTLIESKAVPGKGCTLCYRCVNHCPVQAIRLAGNAKVDPYVGPLGKTTWQELSGDSF